MKNSVILVFILLLLLGTGLRFFELSEESMWVDEAFTYHYINLEWPDLIEILKNDVHPVLFYVFGHWFVDAFGNSDFTLRFLPALFGSLSIILLFFVARKLYDNRTALLSMLFYALSYTFILYSQEAKMYAQFMFFILLTTLLFLRFLEKPSTGNILLLIFSNALLVHTHILSFVFVSVELVVFMFTSYLHKVQGINIWKQWFGIKAQFSNRGFFTVIFGIILLYIPWLPVAWSQYYRLGTYLPFKFHQKTGFGSFYSFYAIVGLCIVVSLLLLFVVCRSLRNKKFIHFIHKTFTKVRKMDFVFAFIFLAWIAINVIFREHFFGNLFYVRYTLFAYPFIHILFARKLLTMKNTRVFVSLLVIYLLGTAAILTTYYSVDGKEQFREASEYITENAGFNDVILFHTGGHVWYAFNFYYEGDIKQIRLHEKGDLRYRELVGRNHAYLLLSHNYETKDYFKEKMDKMYDRVQTKEFIGITIYKYRVSS